MSDRSSLDPFDLLEAHGATMLLDAPSAESPAARELLVQIMAEPRPAPLRRRPRWRLAAVVAAGVVAVAATWIILVDDVSEPAGVVCFAATDLDADRVVVVPDGATDLEPGTCAPVWMAGELSNALVAPGTVPPLQGCVSDAGTLFVFPTDDAAACGRFGLGVANPIVGDAADPVLELRTRVSDFIVAAGCADVAATEQMVTDTLAELGMVGWSVAVEAPATVERPCASVAYDVAAQRVAITPIPPAG